MSRRAASRIFAAAALFAITAIGALPPAAAPPPVPHPEDAPHGIANQAADRDASSKPPVEDRGPVAVPEPTPLALRHARGNDFLWVFDQVWGLALPAAILFSGFSARLRNAARRAGRSWFGTIVVYFVLLRLIIFAVELPMSYYAGFVRPHAYGLSNQAFAKWAGDEAKALAVGLVAGSLLLWLPYLLAKKSPRRWWLWTSLVAIPIIAFFMLIAPVVIDPLFNNFGPMKDKQLEHRILDLASRAGIEGARVFEVDKSADTNTVNAYVTGFGGSKRIVLWDTSIKKLAPDELLFVMGHEMGHFVLGHVMQSLFFAAGLILVTLYAAYRLQAGLILRFKDRFGFSELSDVASLPLVMMLIGGLSLVIAPIANGYSRRQEHEADRFGLEITRNNHAAATAFVKLQQENLGVPRRGILYTLWRADHPLLGDRIDFCNAYRPWESGKPQKYAHLFK
jgi:Zn-dependent protease with chaperone function